MEILIGIAFLFGFIWGRYTTRITFTNAFKRYTDEMHKQYVNCLKTKGVRVKE